MINHLETVCKCDCVAARYTVYNWVKPGGSGVRRSPFLVIPSSGLYLEKEGSVVGYEH